MSLKQEQIASLRAEVECRAVWDAHYWQIVIEVYDGDTMIACSSEALFMEHWSAVEVEGRCLASREALLAAARRRGH